MNPLKRTNRASNFGPSANTTKGGTSSLPFGADDNEADVEFSPMLNHLRAAWERNKRAKLEIEQVMLKAMRQRQQQYEIEVRQAILENGGSNLYWGLTDTKCRAAESWFVDVLMPAGEDPFGIEPTPIPELSPDLTNQIEQEAMQAVMMAQMQMEEMTGMPMDPEVMQATMGLVQDQLWMETHKVLDEESETRAENMQKLIHDQFVEGGFREALRDCIKDMVTFPAAVMKGPFFIRKKEKTWVPSDDGYVPKVQEKIVMCFKRVSPFDIYPEGDAEDTQDGDLFERMRFSRRQMRQFMGVKGFNDEAIEEALKEYGEGGLREWSTVDQDRNDLENRMSTSLFDSNKIEVLSYWGDMPGYMLKEWMTGDKGQMEDHEEYAVNVWFCGNHILKAVVNPHKLGYRPIHKACYEEIPGAFWGRSVPQLLEHIQGAANSLMRAVINNAAMSSGPLYEVDKDRLPYDDGNLHPWKRFESTAQQMKESPAVKFHNVPNVIRDMLLAFDAFSRGADEQSGIPAYAHGDPKVGGAGDTSSGLSMLMNASAKILRTAILNFDLGIIKNVVEQTFDYNMLFYPDDSVKGDMKIIPRGSTALLIKEQMAQRQSEFLAQTANEMDFMLMGPAGRGELLRGQAKNLGLEPDKIVPQQNPQQMQASSDPSMGTQTAGPEEVDPAGNPIGDRNKIAVGNNPKR